MIDSKSRKARPVGHHGIAGKCISITAAMFRCLRSCRPSRRKASTSHWHTHYCSSSFSPIMAPQPSVFSSTDILDEIFQWFDYEHTHGHSLVDTITRTGYDTSTDAEIVRRKSLANAARVCKDFQEPALRVLWRQLESLMPLFIFLPSCKKVQENVEQPFGWTPRDIFVSFSVTVICRLNLIRSPLWSLASS